MIEEIWIFTPRNLVFHPSGLRPLGWNPKFLGVKIHISSINHFWKFHILGTTDETAPPPPNPASEDAKQKPASTSEKEAVPLVDYIHNVMKFVDAILSNNATDDHCREFVTQKGLVPLMGILGLPNLPIDFPTHAACQVKKWKILLRIHLRT